MSDLTADQKKQLDAKVQADQEVAQAEAKLRAEKIDKFGMKLLAMCVEEDLTVNDLQVVLNACNQQLELVYRSRKIVDFMPKEEPKS